MTLLAQASARPRQRQRQRRSGLGSVDQPGSLKDVEFAPNPGSLRMRIHTPRDLPQGAPLVVVLHGCTQTGQGYASAAGWLTLADRFGFAVLCPEQTRTNNFNLCFNWYEPGDAARDGGEAASIAAMVKRAVTDHDLDERRVFVTGLSAGGAMTAVVLATWPELFAGGAVIAGLPYGSAKSLPEAFAAMRQAQAGTATVSGDSIRAATAHRGKWPPMSIWHGQDDTIVRPEAGEALARQWTELHGIDGDPVAARTPAGRNFLVWLSDGEPVVELHRIPGMGHGVPLRTGGPDGSGTAGAHMFEVGISSSLEIALGWGIAEQRLDLGQAPAGETPPERSGPAGPGRARAASGPAVTVGDGIREVIETALRAAGLMK